MHVKNVSDDICEDPLAGGEIVSESNPVVLRVLAEYCADPLWVKRNGVWLNLDIESQGMNKKLVNDLRRYRDAHDELFRWVEFGEHTGFTLQEIQHLGEICQRGVAIWLLGKTPLGKDSQRGVEAWHKSKMDRFLAEHGDTGCFNPVRDLMDQEKSLYESAMWLMNNNQTLYSLTDRTDFIAIDGLSGVVDKEWVLFDESKPLVSGAYWCFFGEEPHSVNQQRIAIFDSKYGHFNQCGVTHWRHVPLNPDGTWIADAHKYNIKK